MINAWSLLYDEIYGDDEMSEEIFNVGAGNTASAGDTNLDDITNISIDTSNYTVDFDNVDLTLPVPDVYAGDTLGSSGYETLNITMPDGCHDIDQDPWIYESPDGGATVTRRKSGSLDKEVVQGNYFNTSNRKYNEDESIQALKDYISTTYGGHYTSDNNNVQTLDLIESVGDAESFCRSNAIKYLSRYDKKGQAKRDILKALHYSLLLYHFSGQNNETSTSGYETF